MKTFLIILFCLSIIFVSIVMISLFIHKKMRGTKLWNFVNKHIIADEDDYIK